MDTKLHHNCLNFHTHQPASTNAVGQVYNWSINQVEIPHRGWFSVGLHPWHIDFDNAPAQLETVAQRAQNERAVAIGECGLDRLVALPLAQQLPIFEAQIQLAEQLKKPVIIHCVRAFDVLVAWKKRTKPTVPLVVHGFNNNLQIAQQLLAHGFYFSLGTALLLPKSNASAVIKMLPINRLLLENDDKNSNIETIYEAASQHLMLPIDTLKIEIWRNFGQITNNR